jgi:hypothetical protein
MQGLSVKVGYNAVDVLSVLLAPRRDCEALPGKRTAQINAPEFAGQLFRE